MITEQKVLAITGEEVSLTADTLCLHGDNEGAIKFVHLIHNKLTEKALEIRAFTKS